MIRYHFPNLNISNWLNKFYSNFESLLSNIHGRNDFHFYGNNIHIGRHCCRSGSHWSFELKKGNNHFFGNWYDIRWQNNRKCKCRFQTIGSKFLSGSFESYLNRYKWYGYPKYRNIRRRFHGFLPICHNGSFCLRFLNNKWEWLSSRHSGKFNYNRFLSPNNTSRCRTGANIGKCNW